MTTHLPFIASAAFTLLELLHPVPSGAQAGGVMPTSSRSSAASIPFQVMGNHAYVEARIGDSRPLHMVIETGAGATSLDSAAASELKLTSLGQATALGAGAARVPVQVAEIQGLRLGDLTIGRLRAVIQPLEAISRKAGERLDGLLGYDVLSQFVVELDYAGQRLVLHDPATFEPPAGGETLPFRLENNIIHFPATIANGDAEPVSAEFVLDTGAGGDIGVFLSAPFARQHGIPAERQPRLHTPGALGVGGGSTGDLCRLRMLRLGRVQLDGPTAYVSADEKGYLSQAGRAGLVGTEVLRRFRVFIDYSRKRVTLERNQHVGDPFEAEQTGLDLEADGPGLDIIRVHAVYAHSPGFEAGFRSGDVIDSVGERSVAGMRLWRVRELLHDGQGSVEVTVRRDGETVGMELKRRAIL